MELYFFWAWLLESGVLLSTCDKVEVDCLSLGSEGVSLCCRVRMSSKAFVWFVYIYLVSSLELFLQFRLFYCPI